MLTLPQMPSALFEANYSGIFFKTQLEESFFLPLSPNPR